MLRVTTFAGLNGSGDVDVRIRAQGGRVWMVWEDGATDLGWSELVSGSWSQVYFETIAGPADEEPGRLRVKQSVLN